MTGKPKNAQRAASAAAKKRAAVKIAKEAAEREAARPYAEQLTIAEEHRASLDAQYAQLIQQREQITQEMDRVSKLANQVLGRIDTLHELAGERTPLASPADLMRQAQEAAEKAEAAKANGDVDGGE